jgi:hypothetical protein
MTTVLLLHDRSVDEIVAKLKPGELEQVNLVVRRWGAAFRRDVVRA